MSPAMVTATATEQRLPASQRRGRRSEHHGGTFKPLEHDRRISRSVADVQVLPWRQAGAQISGPEPYQNHDVGGPLVPTFTPNLPRMQCRNRDTRVSSGYIGSQAT